MSNDEPHIRLLVDKRSEKVYEVEDYDGPPEADLLLQSAVDAANRAAGSDAARIGGETPEESIQQDMFLCRVPRKHWNNATTRKQILSQIGAGHTGFEELFYDVRNNLQEDALECYSKHGRPKAGCIDWHDESKVVGNALLNDEERAVARREGLPLSQHTKRYLCDVCPVKAHHVDPAKRKKLGLYN